MRFWIDDLRNPREYVQDWGKDDDIWSRSFEEFMMHMQIHVQGDQRIGHIYFDYNLGTGGTGLDCAMLVTSAEWEWVLDCLLYTSPSPRDGLLSRMPSSA